MKKIFSEKTKQFAIRNKWIIIASTFFIIWKFFLIGILWNDRLSPPEPDDSYIYSGYINSVKECPVFLCNYPYISFKSYTGFTYLSYRIFFGSIAKIFNINPVALFHFSFYLGIIILLPTLLYFLHALTKNKQLIGLSLFFLALYNGSGAYHGFFWVVPSFFFVALFLVIISLVIRGHKYWKAALLIIIPFFVHLHPMSIYSILVLLFFYLSYSFFIKNTQKELFRRTLFSIAVAIISYAPVSLYLNMTSQGNPMGPKKAIEYARESLQSKEEVIATEKAADTKNLNTESNKEKLSKNSFKSLAAIKINYFDWLFPHWVAIIPFSIFLLLLINYKEIKLISLYLSLIIFILLSSLNPYGFRSLSLIWPITYVFYAFGFWYLIKFINDKARNITTVKILNSITYAGATIFIIVNITYSILMNSYANNQDNLSIKNDFAYYILKNTTNEDVVSYESKLLYSYSLNTELIEKKYTANDMESAKYIVDYKNDSPRLKNVTGLDIFFDKLSSILGKERVQNKKYTKRFLPENFVLEKELGDIKIYRNTNK